MVGKTVDFFKKNAIGALFVAGFFLHMWHIGVDLPNNYYVDEPHHLNKAASFGSGHLNPHDFKYPTLWSYTLAGMLGGLYAAGSMVGVVASKADFAQKFFYHQGFFLFCGRTLSAIFVWLVAVVFYRIGRRFYSKAFAVTIAFLALASSWLSDFGLQAVPYSMLVFWAACSLYPMHLIFQGAGLRAYLWLGFFVGLATSSHYVAAPFAGLFLVAFFLAPRGKDKIRFFAAASFAALGGFFLGTPFLLIELKSTVATVLSFLVGLPFLSSSGAGVSSNLNAGKILFLLKNLFRFMDLGGVGLALTIVGVLSELAAGRRRVLVWLLPYAVALPVLLFSYFGTPERYTILLTIPFYIPATQGFFFLCENIGTGPWKKTAFCVLMATLLLASYVANRLYITIPDTRTLAQHWIQKNVPAGEKVLSPGPYEGPPLIMALSQVERLHERTKQLGHPRAAYYQALADGHPGGGYEIFYVKKTIEEILDLPERTAKSFQAQEFIDVVQEGIAPLLEDGVHWVVLLKPWENIEKHQKWIRELRSTYRLEAHFYPEEKKVKGYFVEIYHYNPPSLPSRSQK